MEKMTKEMKTLIMRPKTITSKNTKMRQKSNQKRFSLHTAGSRVSSVALSYSDAISENNNNNKSVLSISISKDVQVKVIDNKFMPFQLKFNTIIFPHYTNFIAVEEKYHPNRSIL